MAFEESVEVGWGGVWGKVGWGVAGVDRDRSRDRSSSKEKTVSCQNRRSPVPISHRSITHLRSSRSAAAMSTSVPLRRVLYLPRTFSMVSASPTEMDWRLLVSNSRWSATFRSSVAATGKFWMIFSKTFFFSTWRWQHVTARAEAVRTQRERRAVEGLVRGCTEGG